MRAKKNREVNIFSASVVDLFASGLGVFLIVAIIALVNQKKENSKAAKPQEINKANEQLVENLEKKLVQTEGALKNAHVKIELLKSEKQNQLSQAQTKSAESSFEEKLAKKNSNDINNQIINGQKQRISKLAHELDNKSKKIIELEKSIESLKEIYKEQKEETLKNNLDVSKFQIGTKIQLNNVQFYAGTDKPIEPYASREIRDLAKVLIENQAIRVEVSGHIFLTKDELEKGEVYDDSNLSGRRAQVVCQKLINLGVSQKRLKCVGYGGQRYLYLTNDEYSEKAQLNRRVEVEVLAK